MSEDAARPLPARQLLAVPTTGPIAAAPVTSARAANRGRPPAADGTPEQIHLTWGNDPARSVVVSWASPGRAEAPRVRIGQRVIPAIERGYAGGAGGEVAWTYHALVDGLRPGGTYGYAVTANNDRNAADPFSATFRTAPEGRAGFRFTSFGDLATPDGRYASGSGQSAYAVGAVETFQPLFHLLNSDLADGDPAPATQPRAGRDFGDNIQASAANRPWMPVPGDHGVEYLARYSLPANGLPEFAGRWYQFRIGTVAFVCLSGDDVADAGVRAFAADPAEPSTSRRPRGYSGGAQTRWLEATLAAARGDSSIDWIVVGFHQCACSSARTGGGSELGIRREWLPLFDRYEVDLVLCGHGRGYERSFPIRGTDSAATLRPHPVTTIDSGVFDTSQGSVHLILGCGGGASARGAGDVSDVGGEGDATDGRDAGDAAETAPWSARRDTAAGYGVAVFDVNPGTEAGGQTSITVRYYHAVDADPAQGTPTDDYSLFETFTVVRPRSDGRRWHPKEPPPPRRATA
jgi:Purple acid Phosphatase, N-terminal domain/Calcineurin-like phosphoesterase